MFKFVCLALLPAAFAQVANPQSAVDCKTNYDAVATSGDFSLTTEDKCEALVTFSKCLSNFPRSKLMESDLFLKNEKNCEKNWKATGAPEVRTRRGNLQMTVDDAKQVSFFRHRREEVNVFDMNTKINDLERQLVTMAATVKEAKDMATKTKTDVDTKVTQDIAALKENTAKDLLAVKTSVASSIKSAATSTDTKLKSAATSTDTKLKSATSATDTKLAAMKTKVDAGASKTDVAAVKASIASPPVHLWSGGPRAHNRGGGWADYDYSRVDFDTAAPYFKRLSNTRFQALQSGYFSYKVDSMIHCNSRCQKHFRFYCNNQLINGNSHYYSYSWSQVEFEITWYIKKGEQFYGRAYAAGSGNEYKWHASNNWKDQHTRIQVRYEGHRPATSVVKCTSSHGLC